MGITDNESKQERDGHVPTIYDIDIDQLEEKPWRKPDADITDWFNYGFTEETWREYCSAQVRMRLHLLGQQATTKPHHTSHHAKSEQKGLEFKPPISTHPSRQNQINSKNNNRNNSYMRPQGQVRRRGANSNNQANRNQRPANQFGWTTSTPNPLPNIK
eukprot:UN34111